MKQIKSRDELKKKNQSNCLKKIKRDFFFQKQNETKFGKRQAARCSQLNVSNLNDRFRCEYLLFDCVSHTQKTHSFSSLPFDGFVDDWNKHVPSNQS